MQCVSRAACSRQQNVICSSPITTNVDPSIVFIGRRSIMSRKACVTLTPPEARPRTGSHPKAQVRAYSGLGRKAQPSVMEALPPVGWLSTVAQPAHMTAVWAWEKTVVLRLQVEQSGGHAKARRWTKSAAGPGVSEPRAVAAGRPPRRDCRARSTGALFTQRHVRAGLTWRSSPGSGRP